MSLTDEKIAALVDGEVLVHKVASTGEIQRCVVRIIDGERRFRLGDDAGLSFGSPSKAGSVASGTSVNGKLYWTREAEFTTQAKVEKAKADRKSGPVTTKSGVTVLGGPLYAYLDADGDAENGLLESILGSCGDDADCAELVAEAGVLLKSFKLKLGMIRLHRDIVAATAAAAEAQHAAEQERRDREALEYAGLVVETSEPVIEEPMVVEKTAAEAAREVADGLKPGRKGKAA